MRILLDECIDESLRHAFPGHDCQTSRFAGLKGLSNGRLLAAAEVAGFEVLLTVDKNLPYQQSLASRSLAVVILDTPSTTADVLLRLVPDLLGRLPALVPGQVLRLTGR